MKTLISFNPTPRSNEINVSLKATTHDEKWEPYFKEFKEKAHMPELCIEEYKKLISESSDLQIDYTEHIWDHFEFSNKQGLRDNFYGWLPHLSVLPEELKVSFIEDFTDRYLCKTNQQLLLYFNCFVIHTNLLIFNIKKYFTRYKKYTL